jgi:hypothetical protein
MGKQTVKMKLMIPQGVTAREQVCGFALFQLERGLSYQVGNNPSPPHPPTLVGHCVEMDRLVSAPSRRRPPSPWMAPTLAAMIGGVVFFPLDAPAVGAMIGGVVTQCFRLDVPAAGTMIGGVVICPLDGPSRGGALLAAGSVAKHSSITAHAKVMRCRSVGIDQLRIRKGC